MGMREPNIPAPEQGVTPEQMISRAAALRPLLREQQDDFEELGNYSEEMHNQFEKAGFYRMLQPKRFGGYEFDYLTYFKTMLEIAKGHPSTGWCMALASSHAPIFSAHWSEQAQIEVYGKTGHFAAPHRAGVDRGECKATDGGYIVNGKWGYCSGVPHSTHAILTAFAPKPDGGEPEMINFIVPAGQYEIIPDWGGELVLGQKASGSNSIKLTDVFVPTHMTAPFIDMLRVADPAKGTYGTRLHNNPMYLGLTLMMYQCALLAPTLGAAFAALDEYGDMMLTHKTMMPPPLPRVNDPEYQRHFGLATAMVDSAEAIYFQGIQNYMDTLERYSKTGEAPTTAEQLRGVSMLHQAGKIACEAVELMFRTAGSSAARRGTRMMRYFGDIQMYRGHVNGQFEAWAPIAARAGLGLPTGVFDL